MSAVKKLQAIQQENKSMICVGLDLDAKKIPAPFNASIKGMFDFATRIIEATKDKVCAYKPNLAFFESLGPEGASLLKLVTERIPEKIPIILDGKRGDIGNTASQYAVSMFEHLRGDWVTINPYMGYDSMRPFLEYPDKGVFVLCLTSNSGSKDFQMLNVEGKPLYSVVAEKVAYWNKDNNCGLVVGATHPQQLDEVRALAGDMPLLIPGVGAQGGALETAVLAGTAGFTKPAVINVSRSVLYASSGEDFAQRARQELEKLNAEVSKLREQKPQPQNQPPAQSDTPPPPQQQQQQESQQQQPQHQQPQQAPPPQTDSGPSDDSGYQPLPDDGPPRNQ